MRSTIALLLLLSCVIAVAQYVHLATHGFVNSQYPELSGLLLTQDPASAEDGILYTGEILGLTFKADLVTLSAVVASLWKVADESTALLMIAFYTELLSGKDELSQRRREARGSRQELQCCRIHLYPDPKSICKTTS